MIVLVSVLGEVVGAPWLGLLATVLAKDTGPAGVFTDGSVITGGVLVVFLFVLSMFECNA